ncbi:hypothetical protein P20480_2944 [Pseudoalteromonas sp. BSi20480]|nr:hypothetical protein P20480_2944 [Pseudoalteromonas sp. BSi20480]
MFEYFKGLYLVLLLSLVKLVYGLLFVKLVVQYFTVAEFGVYGQVLSIFSLMLMLPNSFIQNGLVKYLSPAVNKQNMDDVIGYINASFILALSLSFFIVLFVLVVFVFFRKQILPDELPYNIYVIILVMYIPAVFSGIQVAINNCNGNTKALLKSNIYASLLVLGAIFLFSIDLFNVILLATSHYVFIMLYLVFRNIRKGMFNFNWLVVKSKKRYISTLVPFVLIGGTSFFSIQLGQTIIRPVLGDSYGWDAVGFWQVTLRLSDLSLFFITTFFTSILYPALAKEVNKRGIVNEYRKFFICIYLPLSIILLASPLYNGLIIQLLFDDKFIQVDTLVLPTFIGDLLRIAAYSLGLLLLIKGGTKLNIFVQLIQFLLYITFSYIGMQAGLIGLVWGYVASYTIYLCIVILLVKKIA